MAVGDPSEDDIATILVKAKESDDKDPGKYGFGNFVSWWARQEGYKRK